MLSHEEIYLNISRNVRGRLTFVIHCIQNWISWIRTVWLNWIAWNRNVFDNWTVYLCLTELFEIELFICIKMELALKRLIYHETQTTSLTLSVSLHPYYLSFTPDLLRCFLRSHIASVSLFWLANTGTPTRERRLWVRSCFSSSASYLNGLWDGRQVVVQLLFCRVLLPGFV